MIKPLNDLVLVKVDPRPEKRGSIILTDTSADVVFTGTVRSVGPGKRNPKTGERRPPNLEPGEKVAFLRWHLEHKTGKQTTQTLSELEDDLALLREADILFAYPGNVKVEVTQ